MSRGDRREDIAREDVDRQEFLKTLAELGQRGKSDPLKLAQAWGCGGPRR